MSCSLRLFLCLTPFALTGCGASAASYSGEPIEVAVKACTDYVSQTVSPDDIAQGLAKAGWTPESPDKSSHGARFGEYHIWYYEQSNPEGYSCYIGAVAEDDIQATAIINDVKAMTDISDRVVLDNQLFGSASIRRNNYSEGTRVSVHVNFFKTFDR